MRLFCAFLVALNLSVCALSAVLGVDYGQEFSKAIVVGPQAPLEIVLTTDSKRKDVSGLAIKKLRSDSEEIERIYSSSTASMFTRFPSNTFLHMKSLLGKSIEDEHSIVNYKRQHPGIAFVASEGNRSTVSFKVAEQQYPIEELIAMNMQDTIKRAKQLLRENGGDPHIDHLALTVPEFFKQEERNALLDVAYLSGLPKSYLVNDGMSVAINFALKQRVFPEGEKQYYVVYDSGAGSTRASLIAIEQPAAADEPLTIEFCGYGYDEDFGGAKLTGAIADLVKNKFLEKHSSIRTDEFETNARAVAKVIQASEKAKLILSANAEALVSIEGLYGDIDFKTKITREEFEGYVQDSLPNIRAPIEDALKSQWTDTPVTMKTIKAVILTGGTTRVPFVQQELANFVGEELISKNVNADESAVNGVTIRGIQLSDAFKVKPLNVIDRSIFSYDARVNKSDSISIFSKGSRYPNSSTILLTQVKDTTSDFTIDLYEDDRLYKSLDVKASSIKSKYNETRCPYGVVYNATFSLSENRIYNMDRIEAICLKSEKPTGSSGLLGKLFGNNKDAEDNTDYEIEEPKTGEEQTNNTSTVKKGSINPSIQLLVSHQYARATPMSQPTKNKFRAHLADLNNKDIQREQLQEQMNSLENALYDLRSYLEEEEVISKGPSAEVERGANLVSEYLEWLDYESDDATLDKVEKKILEVSILKGKIELYLKSANEPLDFDQFDGLYHKGFDLLEDLKRQQDLVKETLSSLHESFEKVGLNVEKEYSRLRTPRHLTFAASKYNDTLQTMDIILSDIKDLLDADDIETKTREELFEVKLLFDAVYGELTESFKTFNAAHEYRIKELSSTYNRKLKLIKRKEEKKRAQEAAINATSADQDFNTTSVYSEEAEASSTTQLEIEHDEL